MKGYSNPSESAIIEIAFVGHIEKQAEQPQQSYFVWYNVGVGFNTLELGFITN